MFWKYLFIFSSVYFLDCHGSERMKVIIDTDAGSDDAGAILLALAVPEVEVVAITCTYGNTNESNVETNVLKILTVANRTDIPVFGGAKTPLEEDYEPTTYFGNDGLGDVEFDRKILGRIDASKHASIAMVDLASQFPGELSILTLGPTTNVALAMKADPNFTSKVKQFYIMGSVINQTLDNEFNFGLDPESNSIFLNSENRSNNVLIVSKDSYKKHLILNEWRLDVLGKLNSEVMKFLNKIEDIVLKKHQYWSDADQLSAALMIWPELVTSKAKGRMTAIATGPNKGSVDFELDEKNSNVEIVQDFDETGFKNNLLKYLA